LAKLSPTFGSGADSVGAAAEDDDDIVSMYVSIPAHSQVT